MRVDVAPQVGHDPLGEPGDEVGAEEGGDGQDHDDDDDRLEGVVERAGMAGGEAAVDQVADADAEREDGERRQRQGQERPGGAAAVGAR